VARCSFTAVSYVQVLQFFCPTVLSISRLPLLLLQVCVALKVLAAGNSFQDVATFSGMSVKASVQRKFFWQKFPTESCQKKKLFEGTFACHNKRCKKSKM